MSGGRTQLSPGDISPRPCRKRRKPRAPASARRQTSSARSAGPRARVDHKFKRAAGAAKRHHVSSAPLVGLWQPEHRRRRRHGDVRWRAHSPGRCRLWRCVLMRSVCGAGGQGGRRTGFCSLSRSRHARKDTAALSCHLTLLWGRKRKGNSTLRRCPAGEQSTRGAPHTALFAEGCC